MIPSLVTAIAALLPLLFCEIEASATTSGNVAASVSAEGTVLMDKDNEMIHEDSDDDDDDIAVRKVSTLIEWLRAQDGFVNADLDIGPRGMIAKDDFEAGDLLFEIPSTAILQGDPSEVFEDSMYCGTVQTLWEEWQQDDGNTTHFTPYVDFLKTVPAGLLPSMWSEAGQALMEKLVGIPEGGGPQTLPPEDVAGWISYEYIYGCQGNPDSYWAQHVALLTVQRGWNHRMIPLLDIIPHYPAYANIQTNAAEQSATESVTVVASRNIAAGEAIFTAFGPMDSADIFRDYGIVEPYPQRWNIPGPAGFLAFWLYENEYGGLEFEWISRPRELANTKEKVDEEWTRVYDFKDDEANSAALESLPEYERTMFNQYHSALNIALEYLYNTLDEEEGCAEGDEECALRKMRYNPLNEPFDDSFTSTDTCDQLKELDLSHHETLEVIQSPYQKITFDMDPESKNTCFMLDKIYQICSSYRPHYHEMMVHYSARFLPEIKRVIFIGGGDSMLLHEVLKYPTIEMVIGLELDQTVTRNSFKYFGTQPHFDDEKVQWWFGDATKSLLMLPKEYFGTFDLVLVDLSETVMSNTVTKGLDIMSALSLLLKQDGIFLKNEMYFQRLSQVFKNTIQIHYYGVPLVCSQCMVLGSNEIDFIQTELKDHQVETIHEPAIVPDKNYSLIHDYMSNPSAEQYCQDGSHEGDVDDEQERSPGILLIIEAEDVSSDLSQVGIVQKKLSQAVASHFDVVSTSVSENEEGAIFTTMLGEGYVIARTWPDKNYCGLDVHLWGSFHKLDLAKKAILNALGGKPENSSTFRIVAAGMFGVESWKDDYARKGPKLTQQCEDAAIPEEVEVPSSNVVSIALEESMEHLSTKDQLSVAVLCGAHSEKCESASVLSTNDSIEKVVSLPACPEMEVNDVDGMMSCESEMEQLLVTANVTIDGVILDLSATLSSAQIMHKIISKDFHRRNVFANNLIAVAATVDQEESWRRNFVDQLREFYDNDPGFKANVFFNSTDEVIEITTMASGDINFITNLKKMTKKVEERTGVTSEIRHIGGAEYNMQDDFKPPQFFLHDAYDQRGPYEQWLSQQPVAQQTVFQLAATDTITAEDLRNLLTQAMSSMEIEGSPQEHSGFGEGAVLHATWKGGNIVALWDGRDLVCLNLFTYVEDDEFAASFVETFTVFDTVMTVALRDEMPRGTGRVINFQSDLTPERSQPVWAVNVD